MTRFAFAWACATLALSGCTTYEDLPPGAAEAPSAVPVANAAPFDFAAEARVLTRACVASELGGPAQLQQLLSQGYVVISDPTGVAYSRRAPGTSEPLSGGPPSISVSDPNNRLDCKAEIQPYTRIEALLPVVEDEMARLGYQRIEAPGPSGRAFTRFVGNGHRFVVSGSTSTSLAYSYGHISFGRLDADDTTCQTQSLAPELREGCDEPS